MIGSIIGDVVGSIYEFHNIKTKEFELFTENNRFTDDSVLTIATADWLLHGGDPATCYGKWGNVFFQAGYGPSFYRWLWEVKHNGTAEPYNSFGNGSAMRIGPVGWAFTTKEETLAAAKLSAACTHNHPEGIKGAQAVALVIFMARNGATKEAIKEAVEKEIGYQLNFTLDGIREEYGWHSRFGSGVSCQASVPQAIEAFLEGNDFEDCIRNAISIGGDSDTLGCMTGSMAEAYYGVPEALRTQVNAYLPDSFQVIIKEFESKYS